MKTFLRQKVVGMLVEMGYKTAGDWKPKKLHEKLKEVVDLDGDGLEGENLDLFKAIKKEGGEVKVVEEMDDEPVTSKPEQPEVKEPVAKEKPASDENKEPVKEEKSKAEKAEKKEKKEKKEKIAKYGDSFPGGIHSIKNRLYNGGLVVKKHGLKAGCTDEMVKELSAMMGDENHAASKEQLKFAWHCVNGYVNGVEEGVEEE